MQSVPITTNVVSQILLRQGLLEQHYVIKFVSDLQQVYGFSPVNKFIEV
jgi:hypothetical protein